MKYDWNKDATTPAATRIVDGNGDPLPSRILWVDTETGEYERVVTGSLKGPLATVVERVTPPIMVEFHD